MSLARWAGVDLGGVSRDELGGEEKIDTGDARRLHAEADAYLRAGGVVTPELWGGLVNAEKAALVEAGDRLRAVLAASIGIASSGDDGAAAVLARADGGQAAVRLALKRAAADVAREAAGQRVSP